MHSLKLLSFVICAILCLIYAHKEVCSQEISFKRIIKNKKKNNQSIELDLSHPKNYRYIPENIKWYGFSTKEAGTSQGNIKLKLKLSDNMIIEDTFNIVHLHRDTEGIFEVQADSIGWLDIENSISKINTIHEKFSIQENEINNSKNKIKMLEYLENGKNMFSESEIKYQFHNIYCTFDLYSLLRKNGFRYRFKFFVLKDRERWKRNLQKFNHKNGAYYINGNIQFEPSSR